MKLPKLLLLTVVISLFVSIHPVKAANKVAVIPMGVSSPAFKGDIYHTVPFSSFMPATDTIKYRHNWSLFGPKGDLVNLSAGEYGIFNAPLYLPRFSSKTNNHLIIIG